MQKRCLTLIRQNCKVERAQLGTKAGVIGAIALAMTEYQEMSKVG